MNFMIKRILQLVFLIYVITAYLGVLYLDVYNPSVLLGVLGLVFFSLYLIIKKKQHINKFIFAFAIYHFIPCLLMDNLLDIVYMLSYIILIITISLYISYMKEKSIKMVYLVVVILSVFNFIYILSQPFKIARTKIIFGLSINLRMSENVVFSRTAIVALIAFIIFYKLKPINIKQKLFKIVGIGVNIFTILFLGKLSTLLTLAIIIMLGEIVKEIKSKKIYKIISLSLTMGTFFISFLMPYIINFSVKYNLNYRLIFSGREELWIKYISYFSELPLLNKLFGGTYVRTMNQIGNEIIKHPHNQYLTILVSVGLIGIVIYMILFYKAYYNCLCNNDIQGFMILLSINLIGITDDYIFLTVMIIDSFYFLYHCSNTNRKACIINLKNGVYNEYKRKKFK